jgi:hypothetical protein
MHKLSLKIPDPQTITLGINNVGIETARNKLGYNDENVRNNAQAPVNDMTAKRTAVGR